MRLLTYQRHIVLSILRPILGVVFILTGLVWLSQVIKLVYLFDKGIAFQDFCRLIILILPSLFFAILPLAVAVGVMIGYNKLSHDRELIVLSGSGLSPRSIIKPALLLVTIITIFEYSISLYLLPISYSKLKNTISNFRDNYVSNLIQDKIFTRISKNTTLYVSDKEQSGLLHGIVLFEKQQDGSTSILFAKSGNMYMKTNTPYYELRNGMRQTIDANGQINQMSFDSLSVALRSQKVCDTSQEQEKDNDQCKNATNAKNKNLQEYFIDELFDPEYDLSEIRKIKLKSEGHQRIIWPLYSIVLTALGLTIFMQKPYSRRGNRPILIKTVIASSLVLGVHFLLYNAASKATIINIVLYINVALCLFVSYYLLNRVSGYH